MVSTISRVALSPEIGADRVAVLENGTTIPCARRLVTTDFRTQPEGPGPLLRTPALLIASSARLNYAPRAVDCAKMTPGATLLVFEIAADISGTTVS